MIQRIQSTNWRRTLATYAVLTLGGIILASNVALFLAPSNIAPGGVSGAAIILTNFIDVPVGILMLILNIPLLALGFRNLGRFHFLTKTLYVVLIYNLGADVVARFLPPGLSQNILLNAIFAGVVGGIGTGLVYRAGGTTASTGVISRILQLRTGIPIAQVYFITDGVIILAAGLVFGWEASLYALVTLFIWGMATDYVLEGPSVVRTAFIVTDNKEEVSRALLDQLQIGVTAWRGEGMFTEQEHNVLFCTVSRPFVDTLRDVVTQVDPQAFVVITHGHQATGGVITNKK
ncbi:MAG: YitT family protein [Anaerolineae bacterium]|nr:YitT family protein [Anaerolineae bacterium]